MEAPRFSDADLIAFVQASIAHRGAATLNLGVYQDGTIGARTLRQMQALKQAIRKP